MSTPQPTVLPGSWSSARVALRRPLESDAPAVFAYASDAEVTHFMDWRTLGDVSEAIQFARDSARTWESGEEFTWVATELGNDLVIGAASCRVRGAVADFGYVLNRRYWGRGLATEMAIALVDMLFADARINRVWASCDAENIRSRRVLEKSRLLYEGLVQSGPARPNISADPRPACIFGKNRST